jgi:hypothetical protein
MSHATDVLERLIGQMGEQAGPVEEVIGEWRGPEVALAATSTSEGAPRALAASVVKELGATWGATGDPAWVEGLVPGHGEDEGPELDYMFALYRRPRIYAYARLRGDSGDPPESMRMILGVIRKPQDHGD